VVDVAGSPSNAMQVWRATLRRRRLIVVLDDAAGSDQVEPLLPGHSESLVLMVRLSASRLALRPTWTITDLADELERAEHRLDAFGLSAATAIAGADPSHVEVMLDGWLPITSSMKSVDADIGSMI
jgi:hypothetical protein